MNVTLAVLLTHPFAFGEGERRPVIVGGVRSIFTLDSVVREGFPPRSVQVPWTDWFLPSPRVVGPETVSTPERLSVHEKLTVTGPLFQPCALGGIDRELDMVGGVRSMLMFPTVDEAALPARSTHVPVTDCGPS